MTDESSSRRVAIQLNQYMENEGIKKDYPPETCVYACIKITDSIPTPKECLMECDGLDLDCIHYSPVGSSHPQTPNPTRSLPRDEVKPIS